VGIAWFGGTVLISQFVPELRKWRYIGLALLLVSGLILFWLHPMQYSNSISFRVKILLLIALTRTKPASLACIVGSDHRRITRDRILVIRERLRNYRNPFSECFEFEFR
jgi:hypothetical protein